VLATIILTGSRQKKRGKEEGELIVATPASPSESPGMETPQCCDLCGVKVWACTLCLEQTVAGTYLVSSEGYNKLGLLSACY